MCSLRLTNTYSRVFIALEAWNELQPLSDYWFKLNMHLSTCALQFLPCFIQNGNWKLEVENGKWNVRSGLPYFVQPNQQARFFTCGRGNLKRGGPGRYNRSLVPRPSSPGSGDEAIAIASETL